MIAGALEFTLGLQANQFLGQLGLSSQGLLSFFGVVGSIESAFHKMWEAVEKGGALKDLAAKTDTSVKSLYELQFAFEQVGASIEGVGPMILKLQRQLGSDEGRGMLQNLGLDPSKLKGQESVDQIEAVIGALQKLNPSQQAAAAFNLFGREGGATALQLARSGHEFHDAIKDAEPMADVWQRVAVSFDEITDKVLKIKHIIETGWAAAAGAIVAAFKSEGLIGVFSLITDGIVLAFKSAVTFLPPVLAKIGEILLRVLEVPLTYLQAGMEYAIQQAINNPLVKGIIQLLPGGAALSFGLDQIVGKSGPQTFDDVLKERQAEGLKFNLGTGEFGLGDISEAANKDMVDALAKVEADGAALQAQITDLLSGLPQSTAGRGPIRTEDIIEGKHTLSEKTPLEKMGAIFGGLGRGFGQDHARATADNTRRTADTVKAIYDKMSGDETNSFANI